MKKPMKQTITVHAKSGLDLSLAITYMTDSFADLKDSGDGPEQAFYELGPAEKSDADFED